MVHVDPIVHAVPPEDRPDLADEAWKQAYEEAYEAWDMLAGTKHPELGGAPEILDVVGVNVYHFSQAQLNADKSREVLGPRDPRRKPLGEMLLFAWERYHRPLLSYCRHVLGSHHEAEEAVQQVFVNAYRAMAGDDERELQVRPWLYRIARNQCLSMLRARRPTEELGAGEPSLVGLSDEVAGRADLRAMLRDLAALPTDQREALVLAELHDNSHAQVAEILGCDHNKVKSLVFQARTSLMTSRQARELRCEEVQSQLSVLRGGSLRRAVLRRHLAECDACRLFGAEVKRQRAALAVVLPVVPTGGLKLGAATALAAGTGAAASTGTATTAGAGAGIAAKLGVPTTLLKSAAATLAVTTAAAGGVATTAQVAHVTGKPRAPITQQAEQSQPAAPGAPADAAGAQPPPVDPDAPNIYTAVQEQLGLKLENAKGPVDVIVIDRIERPTLD